MIEGSPAPAAAAALAGWSWRRLMVAPHRLAFFLAMLVLAGSGLWWSIVQADRVFGIGLPYELSPSVVHSALMTFGFNKRAIRQLIDTAASPERRAA